MMTMTNRTEQPEQNGNGNGGGAAGRPESDYSRPTKRDPRGMRTGYTTGTTAAAAAKAAVMLMLSGQAPEEVSVPLPGGTGGGYAESASQLAGVAGGRGALLRNQGRGR